MSEKRNIESSGVCMAFFLFIVFVFAMVGVFRPYKFWPQGKRWHYGLAAFATVIAIGAIAPDKSETANTAAEALSGSTVTTADTDKPASEIDNPPSSKWVYDTQTDEMRGSVAKFATVNSENTINFDFPYGEQPGIITVRQDPKYGLDVIFSVPNGQILCHNFTDSYLNVKFDDGPIRKFNCTSASDGSSEVSFVTGPKQFLNALKSANRTVIEAEFYQAGRQQYVFDTRDLTWEN